MYNIINFEQIDSTNNYAKLNLNKILDRTVICADSQSAGRGRFNRKWVDMGRGNLFISLVLKPSCVFEKNYAALTQFTAVILCRIFEEYGVQPEIKWPNDVLIDGKKIAGILSESVIKGSSLQGLIIGIGINLNADKDSLSLVADKKITALNVELLREYEDKKLFLDKFLYGFFSSYDRFLSGGFLCIKDEYSKRCNFLSERICVNLLNKQVKGIAERFTDSGELVLKADNGEIILTAGDILY